MLEDILKIYIQKSTEYLGKNIVQILYKAGEIVGETYGKNSMIDIIIEFRKLGMNLTNKTTQNDIKVFLTNSFEARIHGRTGKTNCHLLSGFFASIWRQHLKSQFVQCEEIECLSKGNKNCIFIIKDIPPYPMVIEPIRERHTPFEIIERSHIEVPIKEEVFP